MNTQIAIQESDLELIVSEKTLYWRCISVVTLKDDISYLLPT